MRLEAQNVSFRYKAGPWILRNLSLSVMPGEIVGLTGPSGCGKTTLARLLAGFERPDAGKIALDGQPLPAAGYCPVQLISQHPEQAVNPRWQMHNTLCESYLPDKSLLEELGIKNEWLKRWPNELSAGELQRFCVARALGPQTRFLLADEMTTMLDAVTQAQIWQAVLRLAGERRIGILLTSHDSTLIKRISHRNIDLTSIF
ncbi:MAG: ATP-binding cassette domain-containing protein [Dethiobacter sp.]|nr:ATP-binding cassette domain-containing protein [Dethiobacter sp.]MBS3901212.1 ATP-binding cassette domain-containing protein [Dethiobacter sp.]